MGRWRPPTRPGSRYITPEGEARLRAELDLLLMLGGKRYGVEFKCADAPLMTKSLHIALADLQLERAWIVYPGQDAYPVHEKVTVCPLAQLLKELP